MHIQTHTFGSLLPETLIISTRGPFCVRKLNAVRNKRLFQRVDLVFSSSIAWKWNCGVSTWDGYLIMNAGHPPLKNRGAIISACEGQSSSTGLKRTRKVVEHVCLLKAKENLSDEEEKDMLDYLYTSQYQMRGVVAISLGRISDQNFGNYTHAIFMRFQRKEDLSKFYTNPFYLGVLEKHVMPYCHGMINVDYESGVEDDILPIFRKGEEFNYGLEFVLLVAFVENAPGEAAKDALASLEKLTTEFPSLVVQATQGSNFNSSSREYTHGIVIRFQSLDAFKIFMGSTEYKNMWRCKFEPITQRVLSIHFSVDPVGTEIM